MGAIRVINREQNAGQLKAKFKEKKNTQQKFSDVFDAVRVSPQKDRSFR